MATSPNCGCSRSSNVNGTRSSTIEPSGAIGEYRDNRSARSAPRRFAAVSDVFGSLARFPRRQLKHLRHHFNLAEEALKLHGDSVRVPICGTRNGRVRYQCDKWVTDRCEIAVKSHSSTIAGPIAAAAADSRWPIGRGRNSPDRQFPGASKLHCSPASECPEYRARFGSTDGSAPRLP